MSSFWTKKRGDEGDSYAPAVPRYGRISIAIAAGLVSLVFLAALVVAFPFKKTPQGEIGLRYGGGIVEGAHFEGIVQPGSNLFFNGWGDALYLYPTTQRSYIISKNAHEGDLKKVDYISAPTHDNINVQWEVAVYFKLNTNPTVLQDFHQRIGLKYRAWTTSGWDEMLLNLFRPQIEQSLQTETRSLTAEEIKSDPNTLQQVQHSVGTILKDNINNVLGGPYFCGVDFVPGSTACNDFTFVIKNVTFPPNVDAAFEANQTSLIGVQTEQNKVIQAKYQAESISRVAHALKDAPQSYVILQAINSGKITFWVLPGGSGGINIQGPQP